MDDTPAIEIDFERDIELGPLPKHNQFDTFVEEPSMAQLLSNKKAVCSNSLDEKPSFDQERIQQFKSAKDALLDVFMPKGTIEVDRAM